MKTACFSTVTDFIGFLKAGSSENTRVSVKRSKQHQSRSTQLLRPALLPVLPATYCIILPVFFTV